MAGLEIDEDFEFDQARIGVFNQPKNDQSHLIDNQTIDCLDDEFPDFDDEISLSVLNEPLAMAAEVPSMKLIPAKKVEAPVKKKTDFLSKNKTAVSKTPVLKKKDQKTKPPVMTKEAKKMAALDAKTAAKLLSPPVREPFTAKSLWNKMMPKRNPRTRKESTTSQQSATPTTGKKTPVPSSATGTLRKTVPNYARPTIVTANKVVAKSQKSRAYGDGTELDNISDLKVTKSLEAKYLKPISPKKPTITTPKKQSGVSLGQLSRNTMGSRQTEVDRPFNLSLRSSRPPPASRSTKPVKPRKQPALIQSRAPTREKTVGSMVCLLSLTLRFMIRKVKSGLEMKRFWLDLRPRQIENQS
jgi:hypothetical protein